MQTVPRPEEMPDELCDRLFHSEEEFWGSGGLALLDGPSVGPSLRDGYSPLSSSLALPERTRARASSATLAPAAEPKAPGTPASKSNFWLRTLGLGSVLIGLLLASISISHQPATPTVAGKPIQDLRVGDNVLGENPNRDEAEAVSEVDPATWLRGSFTMAKADGDQIAIELLRPAEWFGDAKPGDSVYLDLAELGAEGTATLVELRGAPRIQPGEGNVVIGTFKHHSAETVELLIEGSTAPIGVTVNHPIWSEDKQDFVRVDELSRGEHVRTRSGISQVASITRRGPPEPVYNIEVHREHVYRVGELGTLVHNTKGRTVFRALREEDWINLLNGDRILPKGVLKDPELHVLQTPTKWLSASETLEAARRFKSAFPIVELDVDRMLKTGSGVMDHANLLQRLRDPRAVKNATLARELLIKNGIDPSAIIRIIF